MMRSAWGVSLFVGVSIILCGQVSWAAPHRVIQCEESGSDDELNQLFDDSTKIKPAIKQKVDQCATPSQSSRSFHSLFQSLSFVGSSWRSISTHLNGFISPNFMSRASTGKTPSLFEDSFFQSVEATLRDRLSGTSEEEIHRMVVCLQGVLEGTEEYSVRASKINLCSPKLNITIGKLKDDPSHSHEIVTFNKIILGEGAFKKVKLAFLYSASRKQPIELLARYEPKKSNEQGMKLLERISKLDPAWRIYKDSGSDLRRSGSSAQGVSELSELEDENISSSESSSSSAEKGAHYYQKYFQSSLRSHFEKLKSKNRVPTFERVVEDFGLPILEDLSKLHQEGLVHLDVKPDNVLVHETLTGLLQVKLSDFDTVVDQNVPLPRFESKKFAPSSTKTRGTIRYMPPESLNQNQWSAKADVWSVAATLIALGLPQSESMACPARIGASAVKNYDDLCAVCKLFCDGQHSGKTKVPTDPARLIVYKMFNPDPLVRPDVSTIIQDIKNLKNAARPKKGW